MRKLFIRILIVFSILVLLTLSANKLVRVYTEYKGTVTVFGTVVDFDEQTRLMHNGKYHKLVYDYYLICYLEEYEQNVTVNVSHADYDSAKLGEQVLIRIETWNGYIKSCTLSN